MSIGLKLAELRLRKRESLQAAATGIGISKAHVWQLEKGHSGNPSIDLLKKLARHFDVPLSFLVDASAEATLDDVEGQRFLRDFMSLSETERAVLNQTVEVFKRRRFASGD